MRYYTPFLKHFVSVEPVLQVLGSQRSPGLPDKSDLYSQDSMAVWFSTQVILGFAENREHFCGLSDVLALRFEL